MEELAARVRSAVSRVSSSSEAEPEATPPRIGMVVDMSDASFIGGFIPSLVERPRYPYSRPEFLFYSEEETTLSADQGMRPVVGPKYPHKMPLMAGYAEVINAGKTRLNEDQATARVLTLLHREEAQEACSIDNQPERSRVESNSPIDMGPLLSPLIEPIPSSPEPRLDASIFAIFDGHAGASAAAAASKCLHEHIKSRLGEVIENILVLDKNENQFFGKRRGNRKQSTQYQEDGPEVTVDQLVIGAIEAAFVDMDNQISEDKQVWRLPGGCAAIAALVFLGRIYVANAGDCRAVLSCDSRTEAVSQDFTPANERVRLQSLAYQHPELIGNSFSRLEYSRRLTKKDLKTKVFYRDWFMDGWASKTVQENDLRPPLISPSFKKRRLLNTIGVSRGLGDHHLLTVDERLPIKPFLSPVPQVRVVDLRLLDSLGDRDILLMASDGLWDVLENEEAARIARAALADSDPTDGTRYTMAAQELVLAARGSMGGAKWVMNSGSHASTDDITAFVIPLKHCAAPLQPEDEEEEDELMLSLGSD